MIVVIILIRLMRTNCAKTPVHMLLKTVKRSS